MTRPCDLNAIEARKLIGNKQLSPVELTTSCIEQIEKHNPSINAVVAIDKNDVLKQAKKAENEVMSGSELGILHGCLLYTSPSPRDLSTSRMPSSA